MYPYKVECIVPLKVRFVDLAWPRGAATARRTPGRRLIALVSAGVRG